MATINLTTQLFEGLTDQEANELQTWAEGMILHGRFPERHPELVEQWLLVLGHSSNNRLLVISTAVPQRVLLSLMFKKDSEFRALCEALHTDPADGHKGVMGSVQSLVDALDLATGVPA